jgi:hypothetical protein
MVVNPPTTTAATAQVAVPAIPGEAPALAAHRELVRKTQVTKRARRRRRASAWTHPNKVHDPGATARVPVICEPEPPAPPTAPAESPEPPFAPRTITCRLVTPAGTVKFGKPRWDQRRWR